MSLTDGIVTFSKEVPDPDPRPIGERLKQIFDTIAKQPYQKPLLLVSQKTFDQMVEAGLIARDDDKSGHVTQSVPGLPGTGPSCPVDTKVLICTDAYLPEHLPLEPIDIKDLVLPKMFKPRRFRGTKFRR